jgi:hypothetical protein
VEAAVLRACSGRGKAVHLGSRAPILTEQGTDGTLGVCSEGVVPKLLPPGLSPRTARGPTWRCSDDVNLNHLPGFDSDARAKTVSKFGLSAICREWKQMP